jgi:hypothetical protein
MVYCFVVDEFFASVSLTVKVSLVAEPLTVPLMTPVVALSGQGRGINSP